MELDEVPFGGLCCLAVVVRNSNGLGKDISLTITT